LEPVFGVAPQLLQRRQPLGSGRGRRNEQPADRHRSHPARHAVAPAGALRLLQRELQAAPAEGQGGQSHAEAEETEPAGALGRGERDGRRHRARRGGRQLHDQPQPHHQRPHRARRVRRGVSRGRGGGGGRRCQRELRGRARGNQT
ncbi:hypothetical protein M9458_047302, partial [Cirrhinus mrigala]